MDRFMIARHRGQSGYGPVGSFATLDEATEGILENYLASVSGPGDPIHPSPPIPAVGVAVYELRPGSRSCAIVEVVRANSALEPLATYKVVEVLTNGPDVEA